MGKRGYVGGTAGNSSEVPDRDRNPADPIAEQGREPKAKPRRGVVRVPRLTNLIDLSVSAGRWIHLAATHDLMHLRITHVFHCASGAFVGAVGRPVGRHSEPCHLSVSLATLARRVASIFA